MKISIITDIEGVSGSVWGGYGLPKSGELPYYTEMMTSEVNTVVSTLREEGIIDIYLYEAHAFQKGLIPEDIPRSRDSTGEIMESDALFFVGQHGPAADCRAVQAHTMNALCNYRMRLNGMLAGELTYEAAKAGAMGVPAVFASGDDSALREARRNGIDIEFVRDEAGYSNHSAICRPFKKIEKKLKEKTKRALDKIKSAKPYALGKIKFEIEFRYSGIGEKMLFFPFIKRKNNTYYFEAENMLEADGFYKQIITARGFWTLLNAGR